MMEFWMNFPFFCIILSLFTAVLCIFLKNRAARNLLLCSWGAQFCLTAATFAMVLRSGESVTFLMGHFPAPWGNEIRFGVAETAMALLFLTVLFLSLQGGWRYLERDVEKSKRGLYCILLSLLGAAMQALTYTNDLFTGYVFLEILTLTACGVLMIRGVGRTTLAAVRYMILNLVGSGLFLLGVILLYIYSGNLLMVSIHESLGKLLSDPNATRLPLVASVGLMTIGLGLKSGLFPFYFWMPDTYAYATPTSSSILSGVVSKGYILLLIKVFWRVIGRHDAAVVELRHLLILLGLCGILCGSIGAIRQRRVDRMLAYSSAAQIGYIYLGIGLGGVAGFAAALYQIAVHALTKPALFLSAARLTEAGGGADFAHLRGSAAKNRYEGVIFTAGALSMVGIPVFSGFAAKLVFGAAALAHERLVFVAVLAVIAVSTLLHVLYYLRTVMTVFSPGEGGKTLPRDRRFLLAAGLLTLLNLLLGVFAGQILPLLEQGVGML